MAGPAILKFQRGLPPSKQFGERLRLLCIQGPEKGVCYSLLGDLIFLGREDCHIVINDTNVSKKHAEISWIVDHYQIRDIGSSNGIVYNGQKVSEAVLNPGDLVMIGLCVFEVYKTNQVRKSEVPLLPYKPKKKEEPKVVPKKEVSEKEKKKKEIDKKRLIVIAVLLFMGYFVFFSDEGQIETVRKRAMISPPEEEAPKKKKLTKAELAKALSEVIPDRNIDTQQRHDADIFFRAGVRELQNKNYRRAISSFETSLTVDPTSDMAKVYLTNAKKEFESDIKSTRDAAQRARKSLRFTEARMNYRTVLRYLEGDSENPMYQEADLALKEMDKEEGRPR